MAGVEGIEPPSTVLETAILALIRIPYYKNSICIPANRDIYFLFIQNFTQINYHQSYLTKPIY